MNKKILITGATDGIGLETAKKLIELGHHVILHGRTQAKLNKVKNELGLINPIDSYAADLSDLTAVKKFSESVLKNHSSLDVLINNAGVLKAPEPVTPDGQDIRFIVNTIAPYYLTQKLIPILGNAGRVINLSSAAQAPVNLSIFSGVEKELEAMNAYAQSKLALTMWSYSLAHSLAKNGPVIVAVNPGSLLGSKMVKEGFGIPGKDLSIGADVLVQAALSNEFESASGKYFDNDIGKFAKPHIDAIDLNKCQGIVNAIEAVLNKSD